MSDATNPYSAPLASDEKTAQEIDNQRATIDFAKIIRRWEPLRIFYNGILIAFVLLATAVFYPQNSARLDYWLSIILGGLIANICFFVGPATEGYFAFFGLRSRGLSIALFLAGLLVTAVLALLCIDGYR